jgi:hypothetical protein
LQGCFTLFLAEHNSQILASAQVRRRIMLITDASGDVKEKEHLQQAQPSDSLLKDERKHADSCASLLPAS